MKMDLITPKQACWIYDRYKIELEDLYKMTKGEALDFISLSKKKIALQKEIKEQEERKKQEKQYNENIVKINNTIECIIGVVESISLVSGSLSTESYNLLISDYKKEFSSYSDFLSHVRSIRKWPESSLQTINRLLKVKNISLENSGKSNKYNFIKENVI